MYKDPRRNMTLLLSIIGVALFSFFLLSPVLLLPADPAFSRMTIGKPSLMIDGRSWVPIYGIQLALQLTGLVNTFLLIFLTTITALMLFLSPFIAFIKRRKLLAVLAISAVISLIGLGSVITVFSPYFEIMSMSSGCIGVAMILIAVYMRNRAVPFTGKAGL